MGDIPSEGDVLAGKYKVEKVLGSGGMGCVVAAMHEDLRERVALKFMLPETLRNEEAVSRFIREARAAARLKSEHTVRVRDIGKLDSGSPYIVMEYLEGTDAKKLLDKGPVHVERAVDIVLQASIALAEAHSVGIVHRDLKPQNLFVTKRVDDTMLVKVLDFGISKDISEQALQNSDLTDTRAVLGSPHYMSPEQMKLAKDVDPRSDIYSLGVCLYQLLSNQLPFEAPSIAELCLKVLSQPPVPLRSVRPEVPIGLETIVMKCIQREREDRYQNVAQLAGDLEQFADVTGKLSAQRVKSVGRPSSISITTPEAIPSEPRTLQQDGGTQAAWGTSSMPKRRSTIAFAILGVLLLGAIGAATTLFFIRPNKPPSTGAQTASIPPSVTASTVPSVSGSADVRPFQAPSASASDVRPIQVPAASVSGKIVRNGGKPPKPGGSVNPEQLLMDRN